MKAILTYEYELPKDIDDYELMWNAPSWKFIVREVQRIIRLKHESGKISDDLVEVEKFINELMADYNIK